MPKSQYKTGNSPRMYAVGIATATAIFDGDLFALVTDLAVPANLFTWNTDLATTQTDFANAFYGASAQSKTAGRARVYGNSEDNILVADPGGAGEWEFDSTSAAYTNGQLLGPAKDTGNNLLAQRVEGVPTEARAIARCTRTYAAGTVRVKLQLLSKLMPMARQS